MKQKLQKTALGLRMMISQAKTSTPKLKAKIVMRNKISKNANKKEIYEKL